MYKRELVDMDRIPAVVRYTRTSDGSTFMKEGLQHKIDMANRALGREYHKMNDEDKRKYLEKIAAAEELRVMKERLGLDQAEDEDKIDDLKQQLLDLAVKDERKQKTIGFSSINDLVAQEYKR